MYRSLQAFHMHPVSSREAGSSARSSRRSLHEQLELIGLRHLRGDLDEYLPEKIPPPAGKQTKSY